MRAAKVDGNESIEARLASIESRLDQMATNRDVSQLNFHNFPEIRVYKAVDMWNQASTLPCPGISPQLPRRAGMINTAQLELPGFEDISPALDNYFEHYNQYVPLFDRNSFIYMVNEWYASPSHRSVVPWAAINIVLALNYRVLLDLPIHDPRLARCIQSVQSATTDLMAWNEDILGLQVLLGMVTLFQGTTNPQLAIVLIGSAVRLAQGLGLPSSAQSVNFSDVASLQRRRIFWIAYILDRVMCIVVLAVTVSKLTL